MFKRIIFVYAALFLGACSIEAGGERHTYAPGPNWFGPSLELTIVNAVQSGTLMDVTINGHPQCSDIPFGRECTRSVQGGLLSGGRRDVTIVAHLKNSSNHIFCVYTDEERIPRSGISAEVIEVKSYRCR